MKLMHLPFCVVASVAPLHGEGLTLPSDDSSIQDHLNIPPDPPQTAEESADPPQGGFKKYYLRDFNAVRDGIVAVIAELPQAEKDAPEFAKVQALKVALDQVLLTAKKSDLFAVLDRAVEVQELPSSGQRFTGIGHQLGGVGYSAKFVIARHIEESNATVTTGELATFIGLESSGGFDGECDWEGEARPIDSPGIMILDPDGVVSKLKSEPYDRAEMFLPDLSISTAEAFARYAPAGNGLEVLKAKFAADQTHVLAKWNELKQWVVQQKAKSP
jgi:hypothetical protein